MIPESPVVGFLLSVGQAVGGGHFMRCLSIARALAALGIRSFFFTSSLSESLYERCAAAGITFKAVNLSSTREVDLTISDSGIDILVIDGQEFGENWRQQMAKATRKLVIMDDLNDPPVHTADAVVNALPGAERLGYPGSAEKAELFLGPKYAPLGPEFAEPIHRAEGAPHTILINFGASDPAGFTFPVLKALTESLPAQGPDFMRVVTGPAMAPAEVDLVRSWVSAHSNLQHYHDCHDMRGLMVEADLAISALGGTVYELAATGVPTLGVPVSANQALLYQALKAESTWCHVMRIEPGNLGSLVSRTWQLWEDKRWLEQARVAACQWNDGKGSRRLAGKIAGLFEESFNG